MVFLLRKTLIAARALKQEIAKASARRWVERQEEKGQSLEEMSKAVGIEWIEKARRSLPGDTEED